MYSFAIFICDVPRTHVPTHVHVHVHVPRAMPYIACMSMFMCRACAMHNDMVIGLIIRGQASASKINGTLAKHCTSNAVQRNGYTTRVPQRRARAPRPVQWWLCILRLPLEPKPLRALCHPHNNPPVLASRGPRGRFFFRGLSSIVCR